MINKELREKYFARIRIARAERRLRDKTLNTITAFEGLNLSAKAATRGLQKLAAAVKREDTK